MRVREITVDGGGQWNLPAQTMIAVRCCVCSNEYNIEIGEADFMTRCDGSHARGSGEDGEGIHEMYDNDGRDKSARILVRRN